MSPKRLLAVLTPIAAVIAVVVALVSTTGNGNPGGEAAATSAGGGTTGGTAMKESAPADQSAKGYSALLVAGSADQVAAELRQKGFDARVVGKRVEVRNATRAQVERALANRRSGGVRIVIVK